MIVLVLVLVINIMVFIGLIVSLYYERKNADLLSYFIEMYSIKDKKNTESIEKMKKVVSAYDDDLK